MKNQTCTCTFRTAGQIQPSNRHEPRIQFCPLHAAAPDMLEALQEVQKALACFRDDEQYVHPVHGELCLEEVKYVLVDAAIAKAEPNTESRIAPL